MRILKTNITLLIAALLMIGFTSCEDYLDVNKDPNNPTEVTPDLILPLGQVYTAHYIQSNRRTNHLGNMFMYNWSEAYGFSWYNDEFQYQVNTTFYASLFDDAYTRPLKQYNILTNLEAPYQNYVAIGMIMKAFHFQYLVDIYGDVPYFQALQRSGEATPAYDDGREIYNDLLVKLDEAVAMINAAAEEPNAVTPGADDTMFGGDMTDWKRFAHTLKVRMLTRMSDVADAGFITGHLATIQNEGSGFITDDVIVDPGYLNEEGKQNPFWATFGTSVDGTVTLTNDATAATDYVINYLSNDPRIDYIFEEPATGHAGVPQGIDSNPEDHAADVVSNIGPGILVAPTMGGVIFTEAEHYFNLSELALEGLYTGNAENLYYDGIEASFDLLGAPGYTSYTNQNVEDINWAISGNKLKAIMKQKWIATMGFTALQAWFDYNRTKDEISWNLPISAEASTPDRPVRLFYPASERASNAENVPAQPNAFTEEVFWAN